MMWELASPFNPFQFFRKKPEPAEGRVAPGVTTRGYTVYDSDSAQGLLADVKNLRAIQDIWNDDSVTEARRDELDDFFIRLGQTVFDDGEDDTLTGSQDDDWFLLFTGDRATDLKLKSGDLLTE